MIKPIITVLFYQSSSGTEPVRDWLKSLPAHERHSIGEDIEAVQFRWPLGMPLVRKLSGKVLGGSHTASYTNCTGVIHTQGRTNDPVAWLHQEDPAHARR